MSLLLGPAFSLVVSSLVETVQQSPVILLKVRPSNLDLIIGFFLLLLIASFECGLKVGERYCLHQFVS